MGKNLDFMRNILQFVGLISGSELAVAISPQQKKTTK
jgi:hypothetical protein